MQYKSASTFVAPNFASDKLSLPEAWDLHAAHSPAHPLFLFSEGGATRALTWSDAALTFHSAARHVQQLLGAPTCVQHPVVGILSSADQITYTSLLAGLMRAGCVPFALSPRNSPQAIAHLLQQTDCKHLFVSGDPATAAFDEAAAAFLHEAEHEVQRYAAPSFEDMRAGASVDGLLPTMGSPNMDSPALILHSSGSTSFPKPIYLTQKVLAQFALCPTYGEMHLCGHIMSTHAAPPFHALGVLPFCWATSTGLVLSTWAPSPHPIVRTSDNVLEAALAMNSTLLLSTPYFIEQWAQSDSLVGHLKSFKHVAFSGAPLNQHVGDALSSKGVSIVSLYGATETGIVSLFPDKIDDGEWDYFQLAPNVSPAFKLFAGDEEATVYEAIWVNTPGHILSVINTSVDGKPAYNSGDLLAAHPSKPGFWRVHGRADDQIMLATGEKTNPGPLEAILMRSPHVASAVMFGRGRFQSGVIVEPVTERRHDPQDQAALVRFLEDIWPAVEEANAFAPQHSRIFKEMIVVAHPDKPFERTPKGSVRRHQVVAAYEAEINAAYEALDNTGPLEGVGLIEWDEQHTAELVRDIVGRVMKKSVTDEDDLFQFGCDSLQATYIRNALLRAFRQSTRKDSSLPFNFVYQNPTIASLISALLTASTADGQSKTDEMVEMVSALTQNFAAHQGSLPIPADEVILLTGSTGGLGSYILGRLLEVPTVKHVFLLNRAGPGGSRVRQIDMLKDRGVDIAVADDERVTFLEGDTTLPKLGLAPEVYEELRTSVTSILHNAWKVDFNLALVSFKPNIVGVRKLIDLALASPFVRPPKLVFISSISVAQNWPAKQAVPEEPLSDPQIAAGLGYGEGKWVAERILHIAGEETSLQPVVVRLGQVSGGPNGAWSVQEWFPSLVKSSTDMGCIPRGTGTISWIPAHFAAAAIVDFRRSPVRYVHLVHPTPVMWTDAIAPLAARLKLELVPYAEWLAKLERLASLNPGSPSPAAKILDFFRATTSQPAGEGAQEALGFPNFSTNEAVRVSQAMEELQRNLVGEADAMKWLEYWVSKGYIKV